jgi:DNA-binding CsgD family transcriptional regulator
MADGMKPGSRTAQGSRTKTQVLADRERVAALYLKGMTMVKIGDELGISTATVHRDLKAIQELWLRSSLLSFDAIKARELARIDEIEKEAWEAWKVSRGQHQRTQTKRVVGQDQPTRTNPTPRELPIKTEANVTRVDARDGNPEFLRTMQWAVEQRCKIFGLYAPLKFKVEELDGLIERELDRIAAGGAEDPDDALAKMPTAGDTPS